MIHVALIEPEIPWNTGNVGRTCLAGGAQLHLIEPLGFSLDEARLRRAGLDYWQHVAPIRYPDYQAFLQVLPRLGAPYFFSTRAERDYADVLYEEETVLVFGRETGGLPPEILERYRSRLVRLPMVGARVRSLNLSTAVGIALYEVLRQRRRAR